MIDNYQASRQVLDLLAEHKLIIITNTKYSINPNFMDLFKSNLKHLSPAYALTRSIDMYCYTASMIEKILLASGFTYVLSRTPGYHRIWYIINQQIHETPGEKDQPEDLQKYLKELELEKSLK